MKPYYQDERVTLWHGDCREVLPSLSGVALTVTSPPYNTLGSRSANPSGMHRDNGWLAKVASIGYADDMSEGDYAEWQRLVVKGVHGATKPGGSLFYNHKCRWRDMQMIHPIDLVRSFDGWLLREEIIWDRNRSMTFNARMFPTSDERVYWLAKEGAGYVWNQEATAWLSVWRIAPQMDAPEHPCPFPEAIPERAIVATTQPGDVVLDPFAGSGTTLRAAIDNGRRAIGIELEERYCEAIAKRLGQDVLDFSEVTA